MSRTFSGWGGELVTEKPRMEGFPPSFRLGNRAGISSSRWCGTSVAFRGPNGLTANRFPRDRFQEVFQGSPAAFGSLLSGKSDPSRRPA